MPVGWQRRPQLELSGLGRSSVVRGAILVLQGTTRDDLRRASVLSSLVCDTCMLVAVDGGIRTCRAAGRGPDLFVGDADSAKRVPRDISSVVYPTDKDFSDLAGALGEVRRRGARVVVVAGLIGGRLDHEWANLQELGAKSRGFAGILAPTRRGTVLITSRGCRVVTSRRKPLSLFPLGGHAVVTLRGAKWSLTRRRLAPGSTGLSNATGSRLHVTVHRGTVAVVFPVVR
jgi:thiamine pyrophosphokinase